MTLQVAVVGIDGSGKSAIASALPVLLSAKLGVTAGFSGDDFAVAAPDEDLLAPGFYPEGLPMSARQARRLELRTRALVDDSRRYAAYKMAHRLLQDAATRVLSRRYGADVFVSVGNAVLSAADCLRPAIGGDASTATPPDASDLHAMFRFILDDEPLPTESVERLRSLERMRTSERLLKWLRLDGAWLPDKVLFLDLRPEEAIRRIEARGGEGDGNATLDDFSERRETYVETLEAFAAYRSMDAVLELPTTGLSTGEILETALAWLEDDLAAVKDAALGTAGSGRGTRGLFSRLFNYRYLVKYLLGKLGEGSWREPLFALSAPGRSFLAEGYSAETTKAIYDYDPKTIGFPERVFYEYPLHRAVVDRHSILSRVLETLLEERLRDGKRVTILSAPSGFAYDLFRPLEAIAAREPEVMARARVIAADHDPHERLKAELRGRAKRLGVDFRFVRGDLGALEIHRELEAEGPFDLALFVGVSSSLPKGTTLAHLEWLSKMLVDDGVLVTDLFEPTAHALSTKYAGHKASYYGPDVFRCLADFAGFDGLSATMETGRDGINHVLTFRVRR